jgi:hypothetical protein
MVACSFVLSWFIQKQIRRKCPGYINCHCICRLAGHECSAVQFMSAPNVANWLKGRREGDAITLTFMWTVLGLDTEGKVKTCHPKRILTRSGDACIEPFDEEWRAISDQSPKVWAALPDKVKLRLQHA